MSIDVSPITTPIISSYLDAASLCALHSTTTTSEHPIVGRPDLTQAYETALGQISATFARTPDDDSIMRRLMGFGDHQPEAGRNYNVYSAPTDPAERSNWLQGFENNLDAKVQRTYDRAVELLTNTQAVSIIQLKNQHKALWHLNRQLMDYNAFKVREQTAARELQAAQPFATLTAVARSVVSFFAPAPIPATDPVIRTSLEGFSSTKYAEIGGFKLSNGAGEEAYTVVAFHQMQDRSNPGLRAATREFSSTSYGKTIIGIFRRGVQPHIHQLGHQGLNHNFNVIMTRARVEDGAVYYFTSDETSLDHGTVLVDDMQRNLHIDPEYRDGRSQHPRGVNRRIDQKLTQIMIELLQQNRGVIRAEVSAGHDDLPVLLAGAFSNRYMRYDPSRRARLHELRDFREDLSNNLFPPYQDYSGSSEVIYAEDLARPLVHLERGEGKSWDEIIEGSRILNPNSAVLPPFWSVAPRLR